MRLRFMVCKGFMIQGKRLMVYGSGNGAEQLGH